MLPGDVTVPSRPRDSRPAPADPGLYGTEATGPQAPPGRPQPAAAAPGPKGRRASLPVWHRRPVRQQPGGTGRPDDEGAAENLWRLPLRRRHRRLQCHQFADLDRAQAGPGHPAHPGRTARQPGRAAPPRINSSRYLAVTNNQLLTLDRYEAGEFNRMETADPDPFGIHLNMSGVTKIVPSLLESYKLTYW